MDMKSFLVSYFSYAEQLQNLVLINLLILFLIDAYSLFLKWIQGNVTSANGSASQKMQFLFVFFLSETFLVYFASPTPFHMGRLSPSNLYTLSWSCHLGLCSLLRQNVHFKFGELSSSCFE